MLGYARPVTMRTLKASMASLAWILGPMMLIFLWMPSRFDPASWNADAKGIVPIVVEIDGEYVKPVTCSVETPLELESTTPATQTLPPIRSTLEELKSEWLQSGDLSSYPWQLQTAGQQAQEKIPAPAPVASGPHERNERYQSQVTQVKGRKARRPPRHGGGRVRDGRLR